MKLLSLMYFVSSCFSSLERRGKDLTGTTAKTWMAFLVARGEFCSGVLFTKSLVITTASFENENYNEWNAYVNVQTVYPKIVGGSKHDVIMKINHPKYDRFTKFHYDISVWWINGESNKFTDVKLDDGTQISDKTITVNALGWGNILQSLTESNIIDSDEVIPCKLLLLKAKLVLNSDCQKKYPNKFSPLNMFCTSSKFYKHASFSDNGGPIYKIDEYKIVLLGLVSLPKNRRKISSYNIAVKRSTPRIKNFINYYVNYFKPENFKHGQSSIIVPTYQSG